MAEYRRYLLTYPLEGNTIFKSKSESKAAKRVFKEFEDINGIGEGLFVMKDLTTDKEIKLQASNGKIYKMAEQSGGRSYLIK